MAGNYGNDFTALSPEMDKSYTTVSDGSNVFWYVHMYKGDNLTVNITAISGGGINLWVRRAVNQPLFYLDTSDTTFAENGALSVATPTKYWLIVAHEDIFQIRFQALVDVSYTYTINVTRTSQSSGYDFTDDIEAVNQRVDNLTTSVDGLSDKIESLNTTLNVVKELTGDNANTIGEILEDLSVLSTKYDELAETLATLDIPDEVNLTGIIVDLEQLSIHYDNLAENLSVIQSKVDENGTVVIYNNETVENYHNIYLYDNETLGAVSGNVSSNLEKIRELETTLGFINSGGESNLSTMISEIDALKQQVGEIENGTPVTSTTASPDDTKVNAAMATGVVGIAIGSIGLATAARRKPEPALPSENAYEYPPDDYEPQN